MATLVGAEELAGLSIPGDVGQWGGLLPGPYGGDCLEKRSQRFTQVASLLSDAGVPGWTGSAAKAYSDVLGQLISATGELAKNDAKLADFVKDQAEAVGEAQLGIAIEQDVLVAAQAVVFAMECKPAMLTAAYYVAVLLATVSVGAAIVLLMWCLLTSASVAGGAKRLPYNVEAWSLPVIAMHSAFATGAQASPVGAESDCAGSYSGSVVGADVNVTASTSRRVSAGLPAFDSPGVGVGRTRVVGAMCGPGPSGRSANRPEVGGSFRDRSPVRGSRAAAVRDGSSVSVRLAGAAETSSSQRAPVDAGLAVVVGNADSCSEEPVRSRTQT
ncbi:EspA/EspE family type VII secretion system effector [Mycobacterium sp. 050134]|uniref:EspA/EspE family type VII secretion system effector n=1 Tax=Mycobacterium sp. 050134 TaxID=3096111 RepID=UPI002ED79520